MNTERFPEGIEVGPEDFRHCGWKEALSGIEGEGYPKLWRAFTAAARRAVEKGRDAEGKVLWLLADACSMMLKPASLSDPFKALINMDVRRSAVPDDFAVDHIELFAQVVADR